ncbi:MAG: phosphoribosyltransferase [Flavobacteriaceae bacterium]|nr:phosphoribosyltransferase [Flavobacteriaceae bacterium]
MNNRLILDNKKIKKILTRIAYQIVEINLNESEIFLVGVQKNGFEIAQLINSELEKISKLKTNVVSISIDKKKPNKKIYSDLNLELISNKNIILVDDVLNTGKTLIHAVKYLLNSTLTKLITVVLIDRNHKIFPIKVDIKGTSISTTIDQRIDVIAENGNLRALISE